MATWATVRRLCKKLPEFEESTWYGTPGFKVRSKGFVRLKEPGVIVVYVGLEEKGDPSPGVAGRLLHHTALRRIRRIPHPTFRHRHR